MPQRTYEADAEYVMPDEFWMGEPVEVPADDPNALAELMLKVSTVLEMVGGTFSIMAIRREVAPDTYIPWKYRGKWESFAPAYRLVDQGLQPASFEPEPEQPQDELTADDLADIAAEEESEVDEGDPDPDTDDDFGPDAEAVLAAREG